jgi:hypothetical protein
MGVKTLLPQTAEWPHGDREKRPSIAGRLKEH